MNVKCIFLIVFCIYTTNLLSQKVRICMQTGYGYYTMNTLTSITKDVMRHLPFEAKIVSNYPVYNYFQPMVKLCFERFEVGLVYGFKSTGSRVSSKDYSGEYKFDSNINSKSYGVIVGNSRKSLSRFRFGYFLHFGLNLSALKMNEFLQTGTNINRSDYKFTSKSFFFEPGLNFTYIISNRISADICLAGSKEFLRNDYKLDGAKVDKIVVDKKFVDFDIWDGGKLGLTISYQLTK